MSKVYLSGPITGKSYTEARFGWRQYVAERLENGIEPLSPMRQEGHLAEISGGLEPADQTNHIFSKSKMIVAKDRLDVKQSDIVIAYLLDTEIVSRGTLVEMGWADAYGKPIVTVMEDEGNIHDHPFVREISIVVNNIDDAIDTVNAMLVTGV